MPTLSEGKNELFWGLETGRAQHVFHLHYHHHHHHTITAITTMTTIITITTMTTITITTPIAHIPKKEELGKTN